MLSRSVHLVRCASRGTAKRTFVHIARFAPGDILTSLRDRGMVEATTHDAAKMSAALQRPCSVYAGFDPTADSLHVGNLLILMALAHFQRHGHRPICLVGGATGMIGDPSGKSIERTLLQPAELEANARGISDNLTRFLAYSATIDTESSDSAANAAGASSTLPPLSTSSSSHPPFCPASATLSPPPPPPPPSSAPLLLNNVDWHGRMNAIEFLRDIGKYFRVGVMLAKDSVKNRLEGDGLSFTEFSYQLLQASDFHHLYTQYDCKVQLGGSDQWGNITAGCDLVRKKLGGAHEVFGVTVPLLTTASGEKFGKSAGNAVWLRADKTSSYHVYQYFLNTPDAQLPRLLRLFTFLPVADIEALCVRHAQAPHEFVAQKALAAHVTRSLHGDAGVQLALRATEALFGKHAAGGGGLSSAGLTAREWLGVFANLPTTEVARAELEVGGGLSILELAVRCGAFENVIMARKMIKQGGLYLNNVRVADDAMRVTLSHTIGESVCLLRTGKKSQFTVRIV